MSALAFQLNDDFIAKLWKQINLNEDLSGSSFHSVFQEGNTPTREQLALLINVSYWTSFSTEEGRTITASLLLREPQQTPDTFQFDNPLDFARETLVKLSPALESPRADIGVWPDEEGRLKIWGFMSAPYEIIKPDFWIQILGPGQILVLYRGRSLAAMTGNQAVFIDAKVVLQNLMPVIAGQTKDNELKLHNLLRYNAILRIAQQMRAHGQGGTILVVPENENWKQSIKKPIKYTGGANFLDADSVPLSLPQEDTEQAESQAGINEEMSLPHQEDWIRIWQQVQRQCNRIARLTAVDGALIMNFDRFVYCFGAKIRALNIKATSSQLQLVEPFENHPEISEPFSILTGTRHQSAAQFAFDQPGSIAIAASQDGNVTFFAKNKQTKSILTLQQAELVLLHEGLGGSLWNLSIFTELGWFEKADEKPGKKYLSAVLNWMKTTLQRD